MKKNIKIIRYNKEYLNDWNQLVESSKNGTFLINRDYMDYHHERFKDHSLLFFEEEKLIAVFPANEKKEILQSHEGLTYGGLVFTTKLRTKDVLDIFSSLLNYYKEQGFKELYYKALPDIYCSYPASETLYALFANKAELYRRDVSSTIDVQNPIKLSKGRKWLLARAKKGNIEIDEAIDFDTFFKEYNEYLNDKYGVSAVHTPKEMSLLQSRFSENIKLFIASDEKGFLGGTILYCTEQVIHAQYIHFTHRGKEIGGFDLLMNKILKTYKNRKYFDFGISTEKDGHYLNEGLISFKESFGARATVYDFYKISL